MIFFLSDILNLPLINKSSEALGRLDDVVVDDIGKAHPLIKGIIAKRDGNKELFFIPMHDIAAFSLKNIRLNTDIVDLAPFKRRENEVRLAFDVYDKQIVDIDDRRLTRVNDLQLTQEQHITRLSGVDVSAQGILKRLGVPFPGFFFKHNIVDWEDVQFLGGNAPMKFNVQYKKLEALHPMDIGRIIFEGPGYKQGSRVLASLKDPIAADIVEELSPKLQKNLIESMKIEDVSGVVSQMPAHKAADLLVTMGPEYAKKILEKLDEKQRKQIQSLLSYPEYTAGAFMTLDFFAIPKTFTLNKVFNTLRETPDLPDFLNYLYVLEGDFSSKLVGVLSMYEFYHSSHHTQIEEIMKTNLISSTPHENIKETLKKMYRYNISAIPVINSEKRLLGVVTFKDAVSIYLPRKWKLRYKHMLGNGN